jgi:polar amino acid transport system permease protein
VSFDPMVTGIAGLALNIGAYGAEVVRGALQAVALQQREAARALNFGRAQTLLRVCLPQAIVEMMPSFGNLAVESRCDLHGPLRPPDRRHTPRSARLCLYEN